jgi:hypothetical protein
MNPGPPIKNVSPPPSSGARAVTTPNARARQNQIIILAVFVIVLVLLVRACAGGENKYEKIAHRFTFAIQQNDIKTAQSLENVGTAADTPRERFGKASDTFSSLGSIKRVKENTPSSDRPRLHEFDLTFDKATVHEKIEFDPQDKIFHFQYDPPQYTK